MAQTSRVQGVSTKVEVKPDGIFVTYHNTVVAQSQGRTITLRSGGYETATTKLRMNQFANQFWGGAFSVFQFAGDWFVKINGQAIPFVDGMSFSI
jgi:hypothetical protein